MEWLYPKQYIKTVHDIDYDQLLIDGYKGIMFDIDNTLAAFDEDYPSPEVMGLIDHLEASGFKVCLVSNNNARRVYKFNKKLNVHAYPRANKPLTGNLKRAMMKLGIEPSQTVFVGDQLFTDVWAGNAIGFHTILVKPIQDKEQMITKVKRGLESLILNRYINKNNLSRYK